MCVLASLRSLFGFLSFVVLHITDGWGSHMKYFVSHFSYFTVTTCSSSRRSPQNQQVQFLAEIPEELLFSWTAPSSFQGESIWGTISLVYKTPTQFQRQTVEESYVTTGTIKLWCHSSDLLYLISSSKIVFVFSFVVNIHLGTARSTATFELVDKGFICNEKSQRWILFLLVFYP